MSTSLLTSKEIKEQRGNVEVFNITAAILVALFTVIAIGVAITGDAGVVPAH